MDRGVSTLDLTVKERILLHLLEFVKFADAVDVPPGMTQDGIAGGSWIDLPHVTQYVRPLVREGLVHERMAHVKGSPRRRKVYELTESGRFRAIRLRERLRSEAVRVRDARGVREASIGKIVEESEGTLTPLEILRRAREGEVLDLIIAAEPQLAFVELTADAPRVTTFVGRQRELSALTEDEGPRFVIVRGVAGIGKSSLAARACEFLRGSRNLLWHRVQPWDTLASLLADVARFLAATGRPTLGVALAKGSPDRAAKVLREELPGVRSFLVFDDVHEASPEAMPFFRLLKDVVAHTSDVRAVVLTRRSLSFYDRRDVALARSVLEIELTGLAPEEVQVLLPGTAAAVGMEVGRHVGGHPLFFELVRSHPTPSGAFGDFLRFMEEQVYAELTEPQRGMMKLASLYRIAVPREALFSGPSATHDVFLALTERSLIRHVGEGRFVVHDTIRDFFASLLTQIERQELGFFALARLRTLAGQSLASGNPIAAMGSLANALELASDHSDQIELLEAFGDATEKIGDVRGSLEAYQKARNLGPNSETAARLYRKAAAALEDRGDVASARSELEAALAALGDVFTEERGWVYALMCLVARDMEELEEAREYGEEALRIFRALGVPRGEAQALLELGYADYFFPEGDAARAEQRLRSALSIAEGQGDPIFLANVRIALANVVGYNGQPEEALTYLAAIEATPAAISDPRVRRSCLEIKGLVTLLLDPTAAEPMVTESIELARKIRDSATEAVGNIYLALLANSRLQFSEARSFGEAAARELLARGLSGMAMEASFYASIYALLEGDSEGFRAALSRLDDPWLSRALRTRYPRLLQLRGLECLLGADEAGVHEAFAAALRCDRMPWVMDSHFLYGVALSVLGRGQAARKHLDRARGFARTYSWNWKLTIMDEEARRLIQTLRDALTSRGPPRTAARAKARGTPGPKV